MAFHVYGVVSAATPLPGDLRGRPDCCVYCFARNTHTYLDLDAGEDFDRQIIVKINIGDVLARELRRPTWTHEPVALGTNTDPYQRAEGRYRLMPGIIAALTGSGTPFSILTKGTTARRDLPLLAVASRAVPVSMGVSIALLDEDIHAALEPGTPTPRARLELVRAIVQAGLPCQVLVAPILPMITDSDEQIDALLTEIAAAGATSATVFALHLRPGAREWFLNYLGTHHPPLLGPYAELYRKGSYVTRSYAADLARRSSVLLRKHGLDRRDSMLRIPDTSTAPIPPHLALSEPSLC
jgi:DNA repair photolyase